MKLNNLNLTLALLAYLSLGLISQVFIFTHKSSAQTAIGAKVELLHQPILVEELPSPGAAITLILKLINTKETELPLQILSTRDGKLQSLNPTKAYLDEYDQPTYEIQTHSPLFELTYQFILKNPDSSFTLSQRYVLRRSCIPRIDIAGLDLQNKEGDERFRLLIQKAEGLSREVAHYETTNKLVEDLYKDLQ